MSDEVVCDRCGVENAAGSNFCSACGSELLEEEATTATYLRAGTEGPAADEIGQLVVTRGSTAGARYALSGAETTVGRHPDSDIFLDDVTVSRRHAQIVASTGGQRRIEDVGSLNGTYLDGERVESAALREGAQIQVGKFRLVYVIGSLGSAS